MQKKLRCIALSAALALAMTTTAFAGSSDKSNSTVRGILHVESLNASATTQTIGYPDVLTNVRALVKVYQVSGSTKTLKGSASNSGAGSITAAKSPSGYVIGYAEGSHGTTSYTLYTSAYK